MKKQVAVIMGSESDMPVVQYGLDILDNFKVGDEVRVLSAHRTPAETIKFASNARNKGYKVIIAAAGGAAHLAGVVAAHTTLPVIGIPIETKALGGVDSLFSTVQMPSGVPVATVAIGKAGAKNAGILAAQILGVKFPEVKEIIKAHKEEIAQEVNKKNENIKSGG